VDLLAIAVYLALFTSESVEHCLSNLVMLVQFLMPWILFHSGFAVSYPIID
jgi:hypothetical protein